MTIIPIFKKCPVCGKKYVWNPDIGKIICPYCNGLGKPKKTKDKYGKNFQLLLKPALLKTLRYAKSQFLANDLQFVQDEQSDNAKSL